MLARRSRWWCAVALWPLLHASANAAQPAKGSSPAQKAPDADLLEFLGSLDDEESDWNEYLESTDLERVSARGGGASKPEAPARPGSVPPKQSGADKS